MKSCKENICLAILVTAVTLSCNSSSNIMPGEIASDTTRALVDTPGAEVTHRKMLIKMKELAQDQKIDSLINQ
jgi:hypothetical protein